jgi:Reverse transcriptase (RNA-dependent DNA polymerase)
MASPPNRFCSRFPTGKSQDRYLHECPPEVPYQFQRSNEQAPHPTKQESCVKLIQTVYGLRDASLTWHQHISKGLKEFGFKSSETDPCLFIEGNILFILYVDDAVCLTPNKADADKLIRDLGNKGYILTDEGPLSAYLGIQVDRLSGNRISMKQPAFIERIIEQCNLKDQRMNDTPADSILHRDTDGAERKTNFHYRSIIGQLNYLAATTRPDITFAVHQCARFCENPKMSHEKAVKRIVRYLKRTRNQGLIMTFDEKKGIECFVDADFAGGFQKDNTKNPRDCLSRTGSVIKYAGCPIVWSSKLQSTIALSTTEAEYMALSIAAREVIYLINLTNELKSHGVDLVASKPRFCITIFEDNAGAIELARLPKLRPRTKHIAIQYHHIRSWTTKGPNDEEPRIQVQHITTDNQQADIFTKPLPRPQFQALRKLICGW